MLASTLTRAALAAVAAFLLALPASAIGAPAKTRAIDAAPWITDGFGSSSAARLTGRSSFSGQHGPSSQHLPAVRENIEVVGKLEMDTPNVYKEGAFQADVLEGQIADLAVYKNTAYLNSWSEPSCERGGFFSVDISNPAEPRQLAFAPAREDTYHGEGAHAITLDTPAFKGDILAVNNEACTVGQADDVQGVGGFELYDVSDPAHPPGSRTGHCGAGISRLTRRPTARAHTTQDPSQIPNSNHSAFAWQDGPKAYVVIVDNTELHDVDIFDITNPRAPKFIGDIDVFALAEEQGVDIVDNSANGDDDLPPRHGREEDRQRADHARVVLGRGLHQAQRQRPGQPGHHRGFRLRNARSAADRPRGRPEGNGHQSEFSHDNRFVLAADEDFSAYRDGTFSDRPADRTPASTRRGESASRSRSPPCPTRS